MLKHERDRISTEDVQKRAHLINEVTRIEKGVPGHIKGSIHSQVFRKLPHLRPSPPDGTIPSNPEPEPPRSEGGKA